MRAMPIELSVDRDPLSHFLLSPRMYVAGLVRAAFGVYIDININAPFITHVFFVIFCPA